ncbi:hypothetical protein S7711_03680 [Stachybotrys chartarum IBT 7711]|uniref:Protein kinase domain-containing protein n=1 Tax=Stachybotrys chartarum (strain CBS 109288 / IBT 7711) TaxID=1280523 RepID=A0A084B7I6_STACB|nr:hypothetical protein S7711_03680 [Stachybotrys chartarum IBT 7711]
MTLKVNPAFLSRLNKDLSSNLGSYAEVKVLTLYWEDAAEGFQAEVKEIRRLFEDIFSFDVVEYAIPSDDSDLITVAMRVLDEVRSICARPALFIIYYGGHGDEDDDHHSGQDPCAMRMRIPSPGPLSFTNVFIKVARTFIIRQGFVNINDLYGHLCDKRHGLTATPVLIPLKAGNPSITLRPNLEDVNKGTDRTDQSSFLHMVVHLRNELGVEDSSQFCEWLRSNLPQVVSGIQVFDITQIVHGAIEHIEQGDKPFKKYLSFQARQEVLAEWQKLVGLVKSQCVLDTTQTTESEQDKVQLMGRFLRKLDAQNCEVIDALAKGILMNPDMDNDEVLDEVSKDATMEQLMVATQLKLRRIVRRGEGSTPKDPPFSNCVEGPRLLLEYKKYGPWMGRQAIEIMENRVALLSNLLGASKGLSYRSLRCTGWSKQPLEDRFTLAFEIPEEFKGCEYVTLQWVLLNMKGPRRPSLNERLKISLYIAQAIYRWHLVGWVHQGISSPNIIFFKKRDMSVDYSKPFLHGFEFARPDLDPSLGFPSDNDVFSAYRHPDRQGGARKGHLKSHDLYSFGVVMLEIGLWQSTSKFLRKGLQPREMQAELKNNCTERLAHYSGDSYQQATSICLSDTYFQSSLRPQRHGRDGGGYLYGYVTCEGGARSVWGTAEADGGDGFGSNGRWVDVCAAIYGPEGEG